MESRKAAPSETIEVFNIYRAAIRRMQTSGMDQRNEDYPTQAVIGREVSPTASGLPN